MHTIYLVYSTQHYRKYIFASIQIIVVISNFARRNDVCTVQGLLSWLAHCLC